MNRAMLFPTTTVLHGAAADIPTHVSITDSAGLETLLQKSAPYRV